MEWNIRKKKDLLDKEITLERKKFSTKKWVEMNNNRRGTYNTENVLQSRLQYLIHVSVTLVVLTYL